MAVIFLFKIVFFYVMHGSIARGQYLLIITLFSSAF